MVLAPRSTTSVDANVPPAAVLGRSAGTAAIAMDPALGELVGVFAPVPGVPSQREGVWGGSKAFLCSALLLGLGESRRERRRVMPNVTQDRFFTGQKGPLYYALCLARAAPQSTRRRLPCGSSAAPSPYTRVPRLSLCLYRYSLLLLPVSALLPWPLPPPPACSLPSPSRGDAHGAQA